jgi:hypothetical protein
MKIFSIFFLLLFSIAATETFAVDFTVNLTTDQHDASTADGVCDIDLVTAGEQCSLRAAVEQANNLGGNDRVLFNLPANSTITLTTANGGEIPINNSGTLEIAGSGADNLTIDGGAGTNRIFHTNQATVNIIGLTLTGGNKSAFGVNSGGAILAEGGALTLDRVHVTGNKAHSGGGVDFQSGIHRIIDSTFSNNTTVFDGAGFFVSSGTTLMVANSTVSGNKSGIGCGGGFCNQGTVTLRNVTITNNTARTGGGISQSGVLNMGNTIVAGNTADVDLGPDIYSSAGSTITSAGGNLVGNNSQVETAFPAGNPNVKNDIVGTSVSPINPLLGSLADNGGTTPTHALLAGSPAIDAGLNAWAVDPLNNTTLAFDQRGTGYMRIVDGDNNGSSIVDIGAFEVQPENVVPTTTEQCKNGGWMTFTMPRRFKNQGDCNRFVNTGN